MIVCSQHYRRRLKPYPGTIDGTAINSNMVAAWLFNEGMGATVGDITSPANNASFMNTPTWAVDNGLYADAPFLEFDGASDYLNVSTQTGLDFTGDFSIFARVYIDYSFPAGSFFPQIMARNGTGGSGVDGWNLDYIRPTEPGGTNQSIRLIFKAVGRSWGSDEVTTATKFTSSQWVDVLAVREGATARIYVNGSLDNTTTVSSNAVEFASSPAVNIGRKTNSSSVYWRGGMDVIRIWTRALSGSDASELHTNPYSGIS